MNAKRSVRSPVDDLGGETPIKPGQESSSSADGKLPLLTGQVRDPALQNKLEIAWTNYMAN